MPVFLLLLTRNGESDCVKAFDSYSSKMMTVNRINQTCKWAMCYGIFVIDVKSVNFYMRDLCLDLVSAKE